MAFAVGALDEAIREYLLYRGFTQTLKAFEIERRDDKDKGFSFRVCFLDSLERGAWLIATHAQVNRIVEYIMQCVYKSDFTSLQRFWVYLYGRFFSQMNSESLATAYRLETYVLRYIQDPSTSLYSAARVCGCPCMGAKFPPTAGCS